MQQLQLQNKVEAAYCTAHYAFACGSMQASKAKAESEGLAPAPKDVLPPPSEAELVAAVQVSLQLTVEGSAGSVQ